MSAAEVAPCCTGGLVGGEWDEAHTSNQLQLPGDVDYCSFQILFSEKDFQVTIESTVCVTTAISQKTTCFD